jgi:two-component system, sensor histidine kinase
LQVLSLLNGTLRRLVPDGDAQEVLEQQEQALGTMSRLLSALLDISKLESGAIMPDICDFPVAQLLAELRLEYAGLAANKGLEFIVEQTDARARSDPTLIGQALKNLVANSIKYTSTGSVRLRATGVPGAVRIEVSDTGRGIAPEHLPYIFDEFYQVGVATNTSRDGYGLGLSIVQRVVRLLELRIDVSSRPGAGSTFALEIPVGQRADAGMAEPRGNRPAAARGGNERHLLLVEDDAGVRNATRLFLKGEGYRVTAAASFDEAVQALERHEDIQLVISDYHLEGGRTGAQVIAAARERFGAGHPAILVTGDTTKAMASLQLDDTLRLTSKPINADDLIGLIQALCAS